MNNYHRQGATTVFAAVFLRTVSLGHSPHKTHIGASIVPHGRVQPETHEAGIFLNHQALEECRL